MGFCLCLNLSHRDAVPGKPSGAIPNDKSSSILNNENSEKLCSQYLRVYQTNPSLIAAVIRLGSSIDPYCPALTAVILLNGILLLAVKLH